MKTINRILFLLLLSTAAFAQSSSYSMGDNPVTTLTNLKAATTIHDISPLLWKMMGLPAKDRFEIDLRRKQDSAQGYYIQAPVNNYPHIVNVVFVDITTVSNGQKRSAHSTNERLTQEQKEMLTTADMSSNIEFSISFTYKYYGVDSDVKEGKIAVTLVPEVEAVYTGGGVKELTEYLSGYVKKQNVSSTKPDAIQNASVLFTVTEDGSLSDIKLRQASGDHKTDKLLLEAIKQMPKWKPAQNAQGKPIKQTIHFAFGGC
jgi:TonB family protein